MSEYLPPLSDDEEFPLAERFFDRNQAGISEMLDILGMPDGIADSLKGTVDATQPWVSGDHSRPGQQFAVTDEQSAALHALYDRFGMKQRVSLPATHYDHLIIPGAIQYGNNRRITFLRDSIGQGITADALTLLGGQRRPYMEKEKDDLEANFAAIEQAGNTDRWVERMRTNPEDMWETDMIRLAAVAQLGPLAVSKLHLRTENADPVKRYELNWHGQSISLLHTLAVARKDGEPRHTTEACVADWLETFQPEQGAKVAFIGANPHLERMAKATQAVLEHFGRNDLQLVAGGPGAPEGIGHALYLGEVARNLYEDSRRER